MKSILCFLTLLLAVLAPMRANPIDLLEARLRRNEQVQEKIYIHTDNNSYFAGDTIWYKAYVLRADNLHPTDMSKLLYVELLTPDGYLVERQCVVIDHETQSHGQFCLPDTIYSGYYELRAYTRWQLNFNNVERPHQTYCDMYVIQEHAENFYRDYEGLYSRVFPIYDKPKTPGNYVERYVTGRPLRRLPKEKEGIVVTFYPEGGSLVSGLKSKVAYEVLNANGEPLPLAGTLDNGIQLQTDSEGRGIFLFQGESGKDVGAHFTYQGEKYDVQLPEIEPSGIVISYDPISGLAMIHAKEVQVGGVAVTCRGKLVTFYKGEADTIDTKSFPTGVNEIIVYDEECRPMAARYVFVNHHDLGENLQVDIRAGREKMKFSPFRVGAFQEVKMKFNPSNASCRSFSISVCDQRGDIPSYDDGTILTNLLLEGDLRGFVAHPASYFESDDEAHRVKLDRLMMIQGWKKYKVEKRIRYEQEKTLSVVGRVYEIEKPYMENDLRVYIQDNCKDQLNPCFRNVNNPELNRLPVAKLDLVTALDKESKKYLSQILVEAELNKGEDYANVVVETDSGGYFSFYIPPFYGRAMLNMCAYRRNDSVRYCLSSRTDRNKFNPLVTPYYQVRRCLFFPLWTKPYSWFQTHSAPENDDAGLFASSPIGAKGADHVLEDVTVKSRRRRALYRFDKSKPAFTYDFLDLYNEALDWGMPFQTFNAISFWDNAEFYLFVDFNDFRFHTNHLSASVDNHYFIKPLKSDFNAVGEPMSPNRLTQLLNPQCIGKIDIFTDYDKRNGVGGQYDDALPDSWYRISNLPNGGRRQLSRDRLIQLDGIAYPLEFYHRDYSSSILKDVQDYRRTLYWNPNVHPDKQGNVSISFYNGSRPSMLKVSICGVSADGKIYYF